MATVEREIDVGRRLDAESDLVPGGVYYADHPLTVDEFYALVDDEDCDAELIDGVIVVRSPVSDEHEDLFGWLFSLILCYVQTRRLGTVRGSRTAVRLDRHNTRLPDVLFVSRRRRRLVKRFDIDGPPDFVAEIVASDSGRRRTISREAEYEALGVSELWRVDIPRQTLTVLRLSSSGEYQVRFQASRGKVTSSRIRGFAIQAEWLWIAEYERPPATKVVARLVAGRNR
jgi:Uma2 family endonuclease